MLLAPLVLGVAPEGPSIATPASFKSMNRALAAAFGIILLSNGYLTYLVLQIRPDPSPGPSQIASNTERAPQSLDSKLSAILRETDDIVRDPSKWPKTPDAAKDHIGRFSQAVLTAAPPSPLAVRNWELEGLRVLAAPDDANAASEAEDLLADRPNGASDQIADKLLERAKSSAAKERAAVLAKAANPPTTATDLADLIGKLSSYPDSDATGAVESLKKRLPGLVLQESLHALEQELTSIQKIEDPGLREYGLARLKQLSLDARLRIMLEARDDQVLQTRVTNLDSKISAALQTAEAKRVQHHAELVRTYQLWALEELKKVREYDAILADERAKLGSPMNPLGADKKKAEAQAQAALRSDMARHMAPINLAVLDEPVAQWYRKVFQKRFEKLSDDEKATLTYEFAKTEKKNPGGAR